MSLDRGTALLVHIYHSWTLARFFVAAKLLKVHGVLNFVQSSVLRSNMVGFEKVMMQIDYFDRTNATNMPGCGLSD